MMPLWQVNPVRRLLGSISYLEHKVSGITRVFFRASCFVSCRGFPTSKQSGGLRLLRTCHRNIALSSVTVEQNTRTEARQTRVLCFVVYLGSRCKESMQENSNLRFVADNSTCFRKRSFCRFYPKKKCYCIVV